MGNDTEAALACRLRAELCSFVSAAGTRRLLPTTFHLGQPGGDRQSLDDAGCYDDALRADLVTRMIDALPSDQETESIPWVTRTGELAATDADLRWLRASMAAFHRHGWEFSSFVVITRQGWRNLATEEMRRWHRVRPGRLGA